MVPQVEFRRMTAPATGITGTAWRQAKRSGLQRGSVRSIICAQRQSRDVSVDTLPAARRAVIPDHERRGAHVQCKHEETITVSMIIITPKITGVLPPARWPAKYLERQITYQIVARSAGPVSGAKLQVLSGADQR